MTDTYEYEDGFEHGKAMRRLCRALDDQGVRDNANDYPFWRGYRDGWRSTDRRLRVRRAAR